MSALFILKGLAIGFSIAAPVGPIGVLCIRRSLRDGMAAGLVSGLGAATADAAYGAVAGFGLTAISGFLIGQKFWIGLLGGAFLCYLGVRTFLSRPTEESAPERGGSLIAAYASTLFLTLANPATILSFAVIFATFGLGAAIDYPAASSLVLGVFLGSALWWLILSGSVSLVRSRMDSARMRMVNRLSGAVLVAFGVYALWRS
jgi:threonine/homoserine/homoserine lactone efflux protein